MHFNGLGSFVRRSLSRSTSEVPVRCVLDVIVGLPIVAGLPMKTFALRSLRERPAPVGKEGDGQ